MEQDVDNIHSNICSTCLSTDRDLIFINGQSEIYEVFRLIMYDFAADRFDNSLEGLTHQVCWECLAQLKRFNKFRKQAHTAQEHLRVLGMHGSNEISDHTYLSPSLSSLESSIKLGYDHVLVYPHDWSPQIVTISTSSNAESEQYNIAQVVRDNISLDLDNQILGGIVIENSRTFSTTTPHIVINAEPITTQENIQLPNEYILPDFATGLKQDYQTTEIPIEVIKPSEVKDEKGDPKSGYITEYMNEEDMLAFREEAKKKLHYACAAYRCELCIIGFYSQQQVENHYVSAHKARPGTVACKVCLTYVEEDKKELHAQSHYVRHVCRLCGHAERSARLAHVHAQAHRRRRPPAALIQLGDAAPAPSRKKKKREEESATSKPEKKDLRKLLSKTTIVGYKCLECDMFFQNSRARKTHVARFHREGLQCDHCKKRFVNRTTLATHLRLHEGPLPREKCPICEKMVRVIQLKYHIQRHKEKSQYECGDCNKVFSHLATYQAHLKYSRAHATEEVFKFPCPMCNKGYPTKEAMQDHFNYQHLGKTSHKCPICNKPIASKVNVERHMMRIHGEKKEKPRNHVCQQCGKAFTDKKALDQHKVIHSGERPLSCDICQQTFKQKASLYTHKKRVHNVVPAKRVVEFMETKSGEN